MRDLTPLCHLAKKYQTDKGGRHLMYGGRPGTMCHEYTPIYYDIFRLKRDKTYLVLELGIDNGQSLRMWEEFFPKATIIGLDWNKFLLFNEGRIFSYLADERSPPQLANIAAYAGHGKKYDVIIDDGSHETSHQITNMLALLPLLARDGSYFVEDIEDPDHPEWVLDFVPEGFVGTWHVTEPTLGMNREEKLLEIRRDRVGNN